MVFMERGELQRSLEAVETKLHREINRREVFERKNADLERLNDDLRLENENVRSQLEEVKQELAEKTSALDKQLATNRHDTDTRSDEDTDSSTSSSSSSDQDANAYENIPNTIETKIMTLKREKAALKQQLKVTSATHMNFEAAFQTELDLRTTIEEELDNLREKFDRLKEENDELRTVLQNHSIVVRPPPRKNLLKPHPGNNSNKQRAHTVGTHQISHSKGANPSNSKRSHDVSSSSSDEGEKKPIEEDRDGKKLPHKVRKKKKQQQQRPHTMNVYPFQTGRSTPGSDRDGSSATKNEFEKLVQRVHPGHKTPAGGEQENGVTQSTESGMVVSRAAPSAASQANESLESRSKKYMDSFSLQASALMESSNVTASFNNSITMNDISKSQRLKPSSPLVVPSYDKTVRSSGVDGDQEEVASVVDSSMVNVSNVSSSTSSSSFDSHDDDDENYVEDGTEQFVIPEGPGAQLFNLEEIPELDFENLALSSEQQLKNAKAFYEIVSNTLKTDSDS